MTTSSLFAYSLIVLTENGKKYADRVLADLYKKEAEVYKALSSDEYAIVAVDRRASV